MYRFWNEGTINKKDDGMALVDPASSVDLRYISPTSITFLQSNVILYLLYLDLYCILLFFEVWGFFLRLLFKTKMFSIFGSNWIDGPNLFFDVVEDVEDVLELRMDFGNEKMIVGRRFLFYLFLFWKRDLKDRVASIRYQNLKDRDSFWYYRCFRFFISCFV